METCLEVLLELISYDEVRALCRGKWKSKEYFYVFVDRYSKVKVIFVLVTKSNRLKLTIQQERILFMFFTDLFTLIHFIQLTM